VTPSYNQAPFLEATIRSVLLQGYPNLEYAVIDGGSTDGSVDVIRRYAPWLAYWASEPDGGQSDAINKGFARATGEVLGWLNSDDLYEPGTLEFVARFLASRPECELVYGNGWYVDERGRKTHRCDWVRSFSRRRLLTVNFILQPAAFWRRRLWERTGPLDVACHWTMDWDWLIRATASTSPEYVERDLACWRIGAHVKTVTGGARRRAEIARICRRHGGVWQPTYLAYQLDRLDKALRPRLGGGPAGRVYRAIVGPMRAGVRRLWGGRYLSDA
jgi:glycosyltransferase involved in cell wall biosynthesis